MNEQGKVNGQIVDSVADVVTLTSGIAPAHAFGMLDTVMTDTLGMAMYNAVSRQQGASMIGSAAATASCARMLNVPFPPAPAPAPAPDPSPAPGTDPMLQKIAAETGLAEAAIDFLKAEAQGNSFDAQVAQASLQLLIKSAAPPAPDPDPSPSGKPSK